MRGTELYLFFRHANNHTRRWLAKNQIRGFETAKAAISKPQVSLSCDASDALSSLVHKPTKSGSFIRSSCYHSSFSQPRNNSDHSYPPLFLLTGSSAHFTNIAASSPLLRCEVPSREQNTTLWNKYWTIA